MEKTKSNRGGRRQGAGRRKQENVKRCLTVRISVDALSKLESLALLQGISKGVCVENLILKGYE